MLCFSRRCALIRFLCCALLETEGSFFFPIESNPGYFDKETPSNDSICVHYSPDSSHTEFILKEVYYSLVNLMQKNIGSVNSPQESFNVSWMRYRRDYKDLDVLLGRNSTYWLSGKSSLQPSVNLFEIVFSPIVGMLSRSRPSVLCTFQRHFRCRGFHKGDCVDSSGECSANTLYAFTARFALRSHWHCVCVGDLSLTLSLQRSFL